MICDIPRKYLTHLNELVELIESVWIDQKCEAMISIEEMREWLNFYSWIILKKYYYYYY